MRASNRDFIDVLFGQHLAIHMDASICSYNSGAMIYLEILRPKMFTFLTFLRVSNAERASFPESKATISGPLHPIQILSLDFLSFHRLYQVHTLWSNGLHTALQCAQLPSPAHRSGCGDDLQVRTPRKPCSQHTNSRPSHVFCNPCSDELGLTAPAGGSRACPACRTLLSQPDDAVSTSLHPTEDYKTSVLSGLSPSTIMECAGRGLAFWSYQSTQEMYVEG